MRARAIKRAALRALQAAAPALAAQLAASGHVGPVAGVVTVEAKRTACAVVPRSRALELMRAGGFDAAELERVENPAPASALPVVLVGQLRGTARIVSMTRGGVA